MSDLSQGQVASLVLNAGDTYRISTTGTATVKVIYGAPAGTTAITSNFATFGPYDAPAKLDVTAVIGTASYSLLAAIPVTKVDGKFSDPALQSLVSGAGKQLGSSALRMEALYRWSGICKNGTPFNDTGVSTVNYSYTTKMELEAPIFAVRMLACNRAANAQPTNKCIVGVTETAAYTATALTASQNMSVPVIGGVAYDGALAVAGNLGFRQVTWAASATYAMPAGNTAHQFLLSDKLAIDSVPRADGGSRHLFLQRHVPDPTGYSFLTLPTQSRTPSATNRGRILTIGQAGADAVATLNAANAIATTYSDIFPIFSFKTPVLSVWGVLDSVGQGNSTSIIADGIMNYVYRACLDVSTPAKPVVYANIGCNSQNAAYYWGVCKTLLALGVPPPSVIVTSPASVNDGSSTPTLATLDAQRDRAWDMLAVCKQYGIPYLIWVPWLPNENLTDIASTFYDSKRKQINAEMKAMAAAAGVVFIDLQLGDGASPEKWLPANKFDAFHPSENAHETAMAPPLASTLRWMVGA